MQISKREFLRKLGLGGVGLAAGAAFGDQYVPDRSKLPEGSCGDPAMPSFGKHIFPLPHTMEDGPSCQLKDGKVREPARDIPVFHETDVVVVGGGPAGFAAAVAAARTGAKVALVERYGSLGGLFTNGMVLIVLCTSQRTGPKSWNLVTRGICSEFMTRCGTYGKTFSSLPSDTTPNRWWEPTIDPECAKYVMDRMVAESKVEMFFHSWGVDVIQDGDRVQGVVFESKEGRQAILAREVVDCTGDADMLFKAGGGYAQVTSGISTVFRLANMDTIDPPKGTEARLPRRGNEGNPDAAWTGRGAETGNPLSVRDLSRIEMSQRERNWEYVQKMRATPGWEKVYTSNSASQIGVRQSRLIDAELVIGRKELAEGFRTDDAVCWIGDCGPHPAFRMPYRQILPKRIDNLLCAGRCLGTGDTIDQFRLIAPCFVTGEAAGTAAALAVKAGVRPRDLDVKLLQRTLASHNVYLG